MISTAITRDPRRLAALCELWRSAGQEVWITLTGPSMEPTIPSGSRVCLRCSRAAPAIGDVVAFRSGGRLIIHRLIEETAPSACGSRRLICKGDGNPRPDAPVDSSRVVGIVVAIQPPSRAARLLRGLRAACRRVRRKRP